MAQQVDRHEMDSLRADMTELGRSMRSSFRRRSSSFRSSSVGDDPDTEYALQWAEIERLPTFDRLRLSLIRLDNIGDGALDSHRKVMDVTKLEPLQSHDFIQKLIKHIENDNLRLLRKIRDRTDKVGVKLPTIQVRYNNLRVEAVCEVVDGKPLPTLWNSFKYMLLGITKLTGSKSREANINILKDVSGVIKPGRMTLLLGPPGCGKTSLLKALSGNLDTSLKVTGDISYNGYGLDEFVPQKSSAYISQNDLHISEMTARETLDFSARCQGVGSRADIMMEVSRKEKEAGIVPDPDIDTYMKAVSIKGLKRNLQTDYILKVLGLDICEDTLIGDEMRRGISGGQKKRLTTGEMIVGPTKALFMDEITNGLDSSTACQIVTCLQQLAHITDTTILVSLLQPAPETFDLFDDIILMAEGKIVYHGPRTKVLEFFEGCGFRCPERKGVADFLQEILSRKDQAQYWCHSDKPYESYIPVDTFCENFKASPLGKILEEEVTKPYDKSRSHKDALSFSVYSLSKLELFKACMSRELLLIKRNYFIYIFKTIQVVIAATITMTVFLRTEMSVDLIGANSYMGALFFGLVILLVDAIPELSFTVQRLAVFYKQRQLCFYPAWAYAIPATILKVPLSLIESLVWTCLTYYVIGYSPEASRFFRQFILLFAVHFTSISMFRLLAAIFQTMIAAMTAGSFAMLFSFSFSGFLIPQPAMPGWLKWSFWVCPMTYGEIGLALNEFLAPRWQKTPQSGNTTIGRMTLENRGLNFDGYLYWISLSALFGFALLFNIGFTLALSFLKSRTSSRAMVSREKLSQLQGLKDRNDSVHIREEPTGIASTDDKSSGRIVLPFQPLTIAFQDLQYHVDTPLEMREQGHASKKLQLLSELTGAIRPGVLMALMGVSGAGKTTLLDVLSGRKTTGYIEGEIRIGGYPKVQETFARISGYCEQTDIHSPNITVEESVIFSAWMRLATEIDFETKSGFVKEVLETIELEAIKDTLVGTPGINGLSTEQRKRLTIAVELVANPSIIFMDEPTTGLDARAAAIVMRAVRNVADTGRTIVCTIHQPSIDIFEAFDELILLKRGGKMIYSGPLGTHSHRVIEYFEGIAGVPRIKDNYNPATWMLEVTSTSSEGALGIDFAQIYRSSELYRDNLQVVEQLSSPPPGSSDLRFPTRFSQSWVGQFRCCMWKLQLSYWRSPSYNLMRIMHTLVSSLVFGALFWNQGQKTDNQQNLFNVLGAMYASMLFLGINNCSSALQYVDTERTVMYRERFAGMYSAWAHALAQVVTEVPYLLIQAVEFVAITYPMVGFYKSAEKVMWSFYAMFCNLMYFSYLAKFLVSVTPNYIVAAIFQSFFYVVLNLFAGFLIPQPKIPDWWIWLYYLSPTSWTIKAFFVSQYGDVETEVMVFGESKRVGKFLEDYFGFRHDQLALTGVMVIAFPLLLALLFAYLIGRLNFQRR